MYDDDVNIIGIQNRRQNRLLDRSQNRRNDEAAIAVSRL